MSKEGVEGWDRLVNAAEVKENDALMLHISHNDPFPKYVQHVWDDVVARLLSPEQ